jgi:subtilisin family serine protease
VTAGSADFEPKVGASSAVFGVARDQRIGVSVDRDGSTDNADIEKEVASSSREQVPKGEPLADLQWDMAMIGATPTGSYAQQQGASTVRVGIIDTGVDGKHPDIKPNFNASLSRNFVTDIPELDGPCEHPSCVDPVDEDDAGHGTHLAGTIGSPINGIGIAGVAPKVTLVSIRAGQDAGLFFLGPVLKALRYAADAGIDVVNLSFYIDPWLYNCTANPADSPKDQAEQRSVIEATQRALNYAHTLGVTLISALGNEHVDLGDPGTDTTSPDHPTGMTYPRTIDNATCLRLPTEDPNVISVSAIGPTRKKADYSNYGLEHNDLSAPGGFFLDYAGDATKTKRSANMILAPLPHNVALDSGLVDTVTGAPLSPLVISSCSASGPANCAYWKYLQGTSMAAPHVAGVAALIVAEQGRSDGSGKTLDPATVERVLKDSATKTACPAAVVTYSAEGHDSSYDVPCTGTPQRNSIYGEGVVNALHAVGG